MYRIRCHHYFLSASAHKVLRRYGCCCCCSHQTESITFTFHLILHRFHPIRWNSWHLHGIRIRIFIAFSCVHVLPPYRGSPAHTLSPGCRVESLRLLLQHTHTHCDKVLANEDLEKAVAQKNRNQSFVSHSFASKSVAYSHTAVRNAQHGK